MNRAFITGAVVVLSLIACESASPSASEQASGSPVAADQVLRMAFFEVPTLDPTITIDPTVSLLLRGLTWFDEDLRTVPGLAESWEVTEGGTQITFSLREASYSSGEPIVAEDFVFGWKRLLDPRNEAWVPYLLAEVVGASELLALIDADLPPDEEIEALLGGLGVFAPDDRTLEVTLTRPAAHFVTAVSNPALAPVPEDWITEPGATEAGGYWSSGPFVLTEWVHDQRRTLEPNPMWWGEPISLERIEMRAFPSEEEALDSFRGGEIDIVDLSGPPADSEVAAATIETAGPSIWHIDFDMTRPDSPLATNRSLREALSLAVDREELNQVVGFGGPVAGSPIPPGVPGHDPELVSVFDIDAARIRLDDALSELGLNGPEELDLTFLHGTMVGDGPRYLEQQWREGLGVEVTFTGLEPDQFLELVPLHEYDMFWIRWFADFPHPQSFLEPPWACAAALNLSGYCNSELDSQLASAAATTDEADQLELYAEAQRILVGDAAHVFLQWPAEYTVVSPRVSGLIATPFDPLYGLMFPERIRIVAD